MKSKSREYNTCEEKMFFVKSGGNPSLFKPLPSVVETARGAALKAHGPRDENPSWVRKKLPYKSDPNALNIFFGTCKIVSFTFQSRIPCSLIIFLSFRSIRVLKNIYIDFRQLK